MRRNVPALIFVAAALAALVGRAEDQRRDHALGQIVAPYVDGQTLIVASLDLMAFDAGETVDWLAKLVGMPDREHDKLRADAALVGVVTQTVSKDSPLDVLVVSSLSDIARMPFFIVLPTGKGSPAGAIAVELRRDLEKAWQRKLVSEQIGDALVTGTEETIERLRKSQAAERPDITAALEAARGSAMRLAFVPSAELRTLVEGIMPEQLPKQFGGGRTKAFTQGAQWVAAGLDLPPNSVAVRVTVQSVDAAAAAELDRELANLFEAIGQLPGVKDIPDFGELFERLRPRASGDQLKLELTEENGGIAALTKVLGPVMQAAMAAMGNR
jgi:hypothetical protein